LPGTFTLHQVRAEVIRATLEANGGNASFAAKALNLGRRHVRELTQPAPVLPSLELPGGLTWVQIEARVIAHAVAAHGGNKSAAARALHISRRSLYNLADAAADPDPL
jgi:transcriptional regulator with PAS, ATPase and Fis domain